MKRLLPLLVLLCAGVAAFAQGGTSTVRFNLNYKTPEVLAPVQVKSGQILPMNAKKYPTREGYLFGGWYTSPACLPAEEWHFGTNGGYNVAATDSMKVEKSMTLYAKWVKPTPIRTVRDLDKIRDDLYGWYVLENDLDLSGIPNWEPIGEYEAFYEYAPSEWWRHAFKGILDGQGHTIRGLRITRLSTDKAGLFATMANGSIMNLNMEDSQLVFTAERPYVAPLVGIIEQDKDTDVATVRNCRITGTVIKARTTNTQPTFHSFTGLCGGIWGGSLENIYVSGSIEVDVAGNGGGELYAGPLAGEAYSETRDCSSLFTITVRYHTPQPAEGYQAFIGGLQASATNVENCMARGQITVTGESGTKGLYIGGLVGSERYGTIKNSTSLVQIVVSDASTVQAGGIVGEFSQKYGVMGPMFGIPVTGVRHCTYMGTPLFLRVAKPVWEEISGVGTPPDLSSPWGGSMKYELADCNYQPGWSAPSAAADPHFAQAPREARPYLWWHWMTGYTSKEGIRKDLEWMNRIGIAGLHQFDADSPMMRALPPAATKTPYLSDAWKENFSYAVRLADSLGMEMGIASAPGWSSTGGPWVEPADAMKKLTWSTMEVVGHGDIDTLRLPKANVTIGKFLNAPGGLYQSVFDKLTPWYQDIAILAVKVRDEDKSLQDLGAQVSSSGGSFTIEQLSDGDISNGAELPLNADGTHAWIQYSFPQSVTIRSFTLAGGETHDTFALDRTQNNYLLCSQDGTKWTEVCRIPSSNVPQITADIPETTAKYFRLMVVNPKPDYTLVYYGVPVTQPTGTPIHEWKLHTVYKVNHAEEKAGFASPADLDAYPTPRTPYPVTETLDITHFLLPDGESVLWRIPEGRWRVYRFGASLTGKQNHPAPPDATGLEVDKLDPEAWSRYFHNYLDLYKDAAGGLLGQRGIQYLMTDSYEAEHMTWTSQMEMAFLKARGYSLRPFLPALAGEILGSTDHTKAFLFDWRQTLGELFAANYDHINDFTAEYGMKGRYTESHESARTYVGDGMDLKRSATIPMAAIWTLNTGTAIQNQADIRESASVAHLYGQNIVAGESFTTNGMLGGAYSWYPGNLKETADLALLSGLNRFFIHESAHQPYDQLQPGLGLIIYGQWFSRHETWAEYAGYWMDYLARSCYLLQAGHAVVDILWYYGEDTSIVGAYAKGLPAVPDSYSYDFCSPHALLNCLSVKDGCAVTASGMSYKVIVLGERTQAMSVNILRKLKELADGGVIIVGKAPTQLTSRSTNPAEFQQLRNDIWNSGRKNVWTGELADALRNYGIEPDFVSAVPGVRFVHRRDGAREIYWVRNFSGAPVDTEIRLRDAAGTLIVLDPVSGKPVTGAISNGRLHLGTGDALFLVADPAMTPSAQPLPLLPAEEVALDGPWTVSFEGLNAPSSNREWTQLSSYTTSSEDAVKYFSGTATYRNSFTLAETAQPLGLTIDLGEVGQMADVYLNGRHVDFLWKAPYSIRLTEGWKPGKNTLEVKVVNVWVNRLIGDARPGAQGDSFTPVPFYKADSPLIPSGLMGPVCVQMLR